MTTSERHTRAGGLFLAACDLGANEQISFLDRSCGDDLALRSTVDALLQEDSRVELFLGAGDSHPSWLRDLTSPSCDDSSACADNGLRPALAPQDTRDRKAAWPTVPGYEILDVLGHGGMGIVYRARQEQLSREVALKVLPNVLGAAHPSIVPRFRREAAAAAKLRHKNIVPIHDFGEADECYYYAMELVDGWPLNVVMRRLIAARLGASRLPSVQDKTGSDSGAKHDAVTSGASPVLGEWLSGNEAPFSRAYFNRIARWISEVADALQVAHDLGIVHRDVKPGNLILARQGRVMITDFGLALTEHDDTITKTGAILGTLRYLSPEQALGGRVPVDQRADIYSLGATLYELMTLSPVFEGEDGNQLLAAVIGTEPLPPSKLNPGVPLELETVCMHAMAKLPEDRYQSAGDLAADLRSFAEGRPVSVRPAGIARRAISSLRRHKFGILISGALLLVACTGGLLMRSNRQARVDREVGDLVSRALILQQDRRWADAADVYQDALELDPDGVRTLGNLAIVLKEQFNEQPEPDFSLLNDAASYCDAALTFAPEHAGLWNVKGVILKKLGRFEDARRAYEEALAIPLGSPEMVIAAHNNLADVLWLEGDRNEAEQHTRKAAQVADETNTPAWFAWQDLAAVELAYDNPSAADLILRGFDSTNEPNWRLHITRARVHLEIEGIRNIAQAVRDVHAAKELGPADPRIERTAALAMLRSGDADACLNYAQEALALGDIPAFPYLLMAIAEAHRGNAEGAGEHLLAAKEAWPEELINAGFSVSTQRGMLWVDTAEQLERLLGEAEEIIDE